MVRPQHQPATQEKGDVNDARADEEAQHAGHGQTQRDEEHVVLVEVAEEAQDAAPLGKHRHAQDDAGHVHHLYRSHLGAWHWARD